MLQLNIDNTTDTLAALSPTTELNQRSSFSDGIYPKLAKLSRKKQWILYTANCSRPMQSELIQHKINCTNVIHLKPSNQYSEEEIVIKAFEAGTASAVVASSNLDLHARARILTVAKLRHCAVFFLNEQSKPSYLCH